MIIFGSVSLTVESGLNLGGDNAITAEAEESKGVAIDAENFPDNNFRKLVS